MKILPSIIFLFVALVAIPSCAFQQSAVAPNEYKLTPSTPKSYSSSGKTISVLPFTATSSAANQMLLYRVDDVRYESDFYNRYITPPAQMLTNQLRWWLAKSNLGIVREPGAPLLSDYLVQPRLTDFYADYRDTTRPRAVAAMRIVLIRRTPDGNRQIFERTYRQETLMTAISPEAAIEALSKSVSDIFRQFTTDFRQELQR